MTKKKILIYNNKKYENFDLLLKDMSNDDLLDLREALTDKFAIYSAFDEKEERFLKRVIGGIYNIFKRRVWSVE